MREAIKEYLFYTEQEKLGLWNTATFVFDTNTLLDLYRYTRSTRESFIAAITKLGDRLFIPYHVAYEIVKNRCSVLLNTINKYNEIEKDGLGFISKTASTMNVDEDEDSIKELKEFFLKWTSDRKNNDIGCIDSYNDPIIEIILNIYEGKVGKKYSDEEYRKMCTDGEFRYKKLIPPGFLDDDKSNGNEYGDYIIWKQILDYSKENQKDIIFITQDTKEDWWYRPKGKTLGPLFELIIEFSNTTGRKFHMYNSKSFLIHFSNKDDEDAKKAISEVGKTANETYKNKDILYFNNGVYETKRIKFADFNLDSSEYFNLGNDFSNLMNKNMKRIIQIEDKVNRGKKYLNSLYRKYPSEPRPSDIQELIDNTEARTEFRLKQIDYLKGL